MAPRKDKNKMIDAGESSAAANKRRRNEILNGKNGVPFTNPFTQFPSGNIFPQQRNVPQNGNVHLQSSPLSPVEEEDQTVDDGFMSWIMPQQNFIINYHMNQMLQSMEEFWRRNLAGEIKKRKEFETRLKEKEQQRKEIEKRLKEKEQQVDRFRQMYHYYEKRTFHLEEIVQHQDANTTPDVVLDEEVQSCLIDLNSSQRMDVKCKNCMARPATMLWLPCRHLCVCLVCERRVKACPICSVKKTESFKINLP